jgi:hypothetical protein
MKIARIIALAGVCTIGVFGAAFMYGWVAEMAYTKQRQESYDRANEALWRGEENASQLIIRPPVEDRSYYK